jgi:hypothetical protein
MYRVEISRAQWGRGTRTGSALRRTDNGKMCCLGFIAKQAGFTDAQISGIGYPHNLYQKRTTQIAIGGTGPQVAGPADGQDFAALLAPFCRRSANGSETFPTGLATLLANINDSDVSDAQRETELIIEAAEGGFEFVFVD